MAKKISALTSASALVGGETIPVVQSGETKKMSATVARAILDTPRTFQKNVKDYGAVGNGSIDDTAAIQAAIDASPTRAEVFIPPGTYLTSAALTLPTGAALRGAGPYRTVIRCNSATSDIISSTGTTLVAVRDLQLESTNPSRTAGSAFAYDTVTLYDIDNIRLISPGNLGRFINCQIGYHTNIRASNGLGPLLAGFFWQRCISTFLHHIYPNGGTIVFPLGTAFFHFDSDIDTVVADSIGSQSSSGGGTGMLFTNSLGSGHFAPRWVRITNSLFEGATGLAHGAADECPAIQIDNATAASFTNCYVASSSQGVVINGGKDIRFTNLIAVNNSQEAIRVNGGNIISIDGLTSSDNSRTTTNTYSGVYVAAAATNVLIKGSTFTDAIIGYATKQKYGIENYGPSTTHTNNTFTNMGTAGVGGSVAMAAIRSNTGSSVVEITGAGQFLLNSPFVGGFANGANRDFYMGLGNATGSYRFTNVGFAAELARISQDYSLKMFDAPATPATPSGGALMFAEAGKIKFRNSNGTVIDPSTLGSGGGSTDVVVDPTDVAYGATGNGTTDDYTALQAALTAAATAPSRHVLLPAGTYNISNTLTVPEGVIFEGAPGSVIRGHSTVTGTLDSSWRYIYVNGVDRVTLRGLTLGTPVDTPAGAGGLETGQLIYILDSVGSKVEGCVADWDAYGSHPVDTLQFVWVKGTGSLHNEIVGNYLTGLGIGYSYAGASHTRCANNTIVNARGNALSGLGNTGFAEHCQVIGNTVSGGGRMGIEDWADIRWTVIRDNHITGVDDYGISAVGKETLISGNSVNDVEGAYGIETGSHGMRVEGNDIRWTDTGAIVTGTGIMVNNAGSDTDAAPSSCVITGNRIENAGLGVHTFAAPKSLIVSGNSFVNIKQRGVTVVTGSTGGAIVSDNFFRYTDVALTPTHRYAVYVEDANGPVQVVGNSVHYTSGTTGSTNADHGFLISASNTTLAGNSVINEKTGGGVVYSVAAGGATPTGCCFVANTFVGTNNTGLASFNGSTNSSAHTWFSDKIGVGAGKSAPTYAVDVAGRVRATELEGTLVDAELAALQGLTSAADRLPYFTGSGTASLATFTAFGRSLVDDADAATARATLGLVIGTNVQAQDTELAALAGLTSAADRLPYFTGSGTASLATFTAAGRALVDDADATAQRTTLGLGTAAVRSTMPTELGVAVTDEATDLATGVAQVTFRMPYAMTLNAGSAGVRASLGTASSSGLVTVDINESGTTILSTKITVDANERTSTTAATPAVVSDQALADDAEITVDIDTAGTGAKGLKIWLIGTRTV